MITLKDEQASRSSRRASQRDSLPCVLYILGVGHSGTTLLNLLLGRHVSVFAAGHMRNYHKIWDPGPRDLMGGDEELASSSFWNRVSRRFSVLRGRPRPSEGWDEEDIRCLYSSVSEVASTPVICENSQTTAYLRVLRNAGFNVFAIHLIRDPRAQVYSELVRGRGPVWLLALKWLRTNWRLLICRSSLGPLRRVSYEKLCANPEEVVNGLINAAEPHFGLDLGKVSLSEERIENRNHMFSSNRIRRDPLLSVEVDTRYIAGLGLRQWAVITILTFPVLLLRGYPVRRAGARRSALEYGHAKKK